ncbi:carboxypeptidase regulatory-like domain-containing protein [Aquincola sp. S2]|uniref:Carboxypeptidase regulatory-like domain-containing protein n=1 Tax=Pseudaquabacterium terrae TaxID=2732868 RepID=A0ABX2EUA2_9BURK|nr:carboxypeptidase regulatory-like domain-containing protein [Aquabacterium terrae]NRF72332.1 carboxypeptidase regulatory-like domain-containing protein [Aquabacterium terrae]
MTHHRLAPLLAGVLAALVAGSPLAAPVAQENGAVRSLSGGVDADEARAMREAAPGYRLGLTFAQPGGAFVAGVDLRIRDRAGRVVYEGGGLGPIVLLDLPAGTYMVEARHDGRTQQRSVAIDGRKHLAVALTWPG